MNKYTKDLVSVIIPTYKRSSTLPRAIESVLNQTYKDIELLVINDNEPEDEYTLYVKQITDKYKTDNRFHLIIQDKHINGAVARNFGITKAKGEYIAFLDDDDWWELNKLELQVKELKKLSSDWGGVSCKFSFYNSNAELIGKSLKYQDGYIYKDILNMMTEVCTCTLLLRHTALDDAGYFDENLLRNQDLQLLVFFTYKYKLKEVDEYLFCLDVSDTQNRPSGDKVVEVVNNFFCSVRPILDTLTTSELRVVKAMRNLEIAFVYFKECKYIKAMKYFVKVLKSPEALRLSIIKLRNRRKTFSVR